MNGLEYNDVVDEVAQYADAFERITIGAPLLTSDADFQIVAQAMKAATAQYDDRTPPDSPHLQRRFSRYPRRPRPCRCWRGRLLQSSWAGARPAHTIHADSLKDGVYSIEVDSSSSMFKIERCELTVETGTMTAAWPQAVRSRSKAQRKESFFIC
mgnify:CR=1 FL=1